MTTRNKILVGSIAIMVVSFFLKMEVPLVLAMFGALLGMTPSAEEQAEEERRQRAAEIAHAHSMTYQQEIARAMAKKEAELMGTDSEFNNFRHVHPEYQRATPKSRTSNSKAVRKFH